MKAGDVFSIDTPTGTAYFQFVKKMALMGSVVRVLPGTYLDTPDLDALVEQPTNFWIFFPVSAALKQGAIQKIKTFKIPQHSEKPPIFRAGVIDPSTGRVETWWFWDGEKEWKVGEITDEQRKLPIRGAWNNTLLIERIVEGWLPENDNR